MKHEHRRRYTHEFKLQVLDMAETSGKSVAQIEDELGLAPGMTYRWKRQFQHIVATLCRVLEAPSSGYYAWRKCRAGGKREISDRLLLQSSIRYTRIIEDDMATGEFGLNCAHKARFAAASGWRD